jgi:pilus assembly protein Flp/PilA
MLRFFRKLRKDENGATAIEYGLIAGLVSVVIIGAISFVGSQLILVFNEVAGDNGLGKALN